MEGPTPSSAIFYGALSVHLVNGVFGTLAVGLFAQDAIMPGTMTSAERPKNQ